MVIDAEIDAIDDDENITTITKQVPPEPTDETFKLAKGETLIDALTDRGVSQEAAKALVAAIEPDLPGEHDQGRHRRSNSRSTGRSTSTAAK